MQYTYDATGLRQSKTVNGVTTSHIWDGTNMIAETDGDGDVTNKYYRGLGLIYGEFDGNKNYYVSNAHGDVCLLLDGNSNITKQYEYDAFGVELNKDNSDINPFRYCGEYTDLETNMIYLRSRFYDPSIGCFISEDPLRADTNWYSYCGNDPINFSDPTGNIREPGYNAKGAWSQDPDADDYGKDSLVYSSLVTLGNNWSNANSDQRKDIEALATVVRSVGNDISYGLKAAVYGGQLSKINVSDTEKVLAIGYPLSALAVNNAQETAWNEVHSRYGWDTKDDLIDGSNGNAFLHCYWNALISKEIGAHLAKLFTDAHEYGVEGNYTWSDYAGININMDLYNNNIGINLGTYNKNQKDWYIAGEVQKYVNNGWLLRIKVGGVIQSTTVVTNNDYR